MSGNEVKDQFLKMSRQELHLARSIEMHCTSIPGSEKSAVKAENREKKAC